VPYLSALELCSLQGVYLYLYLYNNDVQRFRDMADYWPNFHCRHGVASL